LELSKEMQMTMRRKTLIGLAVLGALALDAAPALAQVESRSQEMSVYAGELFGDDLTDRQISGRTPQLDDDVTYGVRYGYNFTNSWGIEASLGQTASSVTDLVGRDIDLDLTTLDLDAVYHFNTASPLVPYLVAGVGYASSDLDVPIVGLVSGAPVRIDDDNGFTANAGAGLKYYVNDRFLVRLEARYRYLDKVVDKFDDSLNTVETTLNVGWKF
jgi:outer membrane beta-barrel protein